MDPGGVQPKPSHPLEDMRCLTVATAFNYHPVRPYSRALEEEAYLRRRLPAQ